jgi:hypothetical protein
MRRESRFNGGVRVLIRFPGKREMGFEGSVSQLVNFGNPSRDFHLQGKLHLLAIG